MRYFWLFQSRRQISSLASSGQQELELLLIIHEASGQVGSAVAMRLSTPSIEQFAPRVRFWKHIEQILACADLVQDELWMQELTPMSVAKETVTVAVGLHLELVVRDPTEARGAVPTCIEQDIVADFAVIVPGVGG